MTDNSQPTNDHISAAVIVDRRISGYVERIAIGLLSFIVTVMFFVYQGHQSDFKELSVKVTELQIEKVSKSDLNDVEQRINRNFDARIGELISRSSSDKADILSRIDMLINSGRYASDKK